MYVNGKMRPVETIPGMGERMNSTITHIIRTFVNVIMYPQYNN
jgi:hypothetical protein